MAVHVLPPPGTCREGAATGCPTTRRILHMAARAARAGISAAGVTVYQLLTVRPSHRTDLCCSPSSTVPAGTQEPVDLRLIAEMEATRATSADLWHQVTARRAELSSRIGPRGALVGNFVGLDGTAVPIQIRSLDGVRRLFRRLPPELAECRLAAVEAVVMGCDRWDAEAAKVGLPQLVEHATKVRNHVRVLEVRVAAQLGVSAGAQA